MIVTGLELGMVKLKGTKFFGVVLVRLRWLVSHK